MDSRKRFEAANVEQKSNFGLSITQSHKLDEARQEVKVKKSETVARYKNDD